MKPEQLKVIAEGMGRNVEIMGSVVISKSTLNPDANVSNDTFINKHVLRTEYNPLTNNDQLIEIVKWLILAGYDLFEDDGQYFFKGLCHAETLEAAACDSIYKAFK